MTVKDARIDGKHQMRCKWPIIQKNFSKKNIYNQIGN